MDLPAGAIRTVDISDAQRRLVCSGETFFGRQVGTLVYTFENGCITSVESQHHNDYVQSVPGIQTGDKDRIGEFKLGVSPGLPNLPKYPESVPYFGYGDGVIRLSLGDNQESGGDVILQLSPLVVLDRRHGKSGRKTLIERGKLA
ncbi:MAG: hypothetical protein CL700_09755 [Chloroflexi bacterium]|nr:hypothetical protein [Chloroflexota bacterium]